MNELKVGFLTLMAIASLAIVTLKITSNNATFGKFIEYRTILQDATGIYENSSIKVAGIVAGKIKKVELNGSQALVKFEVLEQIKVTQTSRLRIKSVGFLGDKFIDIYLGNPEDPRLPAGSMIEAQSGAGFEQIGKDASEILKDVKVIAKVIRESLHTKDNKSVLKSIFKDVAEFSRNANDISKSIKTMVGQNESKINKTLANLEKITDQLRYETDRYEDGSFMNDLERVGPILEKVDLAVADLKEIVQDVKSGKGTVGKLLRDDEVVDQVSETLAGVNKIVNRVNRFKTDIEIYSGSNNKDGSRTEVSLDLMPSPERFFRFGIVTGDGVIPETETIETTVVDSGTPRVEEIKKQKKSDFRFSLQIGRNINDLTLRAGLFETKGGLGVDYRFEDLGLTTSLEAYDYRKDIGTNIRFSSQLRLWNVLFAKVSAEELGRSSEHHIYTYSLGLKFSDEDISSLLGLAL